MGDHNFARIRALIDRTLIARRLVRESQYLVLDAANHCRLTHQRT